MTRSSVSALRHTLVASAAALSIAATAAATPTVAGGGEGWFDDFDKAAAAAKEQNKDLLVDFTGSDWCGWCIKLDEEVFSHDVWQKGVADDYILVALDFPNAEEIKAKVPNPERNKELAQQFGVRGYPTILLMTADSEVYGQTGYQAGGPEKYLEHMAEMRKGRALLFEVNGIVDGFDALDEEGRMGRLDALLNAADQLDGSQPFGEKLVGPLRWAFEMDADGSKGARHRAALALLGQGDTEADYFEVVRAADPKNEAGHLEKAVGYRFNTVRDDDTARAALAGLALLDGLEVKDKETYFSLLFNAAMWSQGPLQDEEGAKSYAKKALEVGGGEKGQIEALKDLIG